MRKIIGAAFVSLDGVMQAPGGPTEDWTGGFKYSSDGGNIIATYLPAGPVGTGTYIADKPSAREQERQAAMADGSW